MCTGIHRAMKTIHKNVSLSGNTTTVWCKRTNDPLRNNPDTNYKYSRKITHSISRCTNIYGNRTTNWCSHAIGAVLLFRHKYFELDVPIPTPNVNKRFKYLTNITNWVKDVDKLDYDQRTQYWDEMINNSAWLEAGDNYSVKNMWRI